MTSIITVAGDSAEYRGEVAPLSWTRYGDNLDGPVFHSILPSIVPVSNTEKEDTTGESPGGIVAERLSSITGPLV